MITSTNPILIDYIPLTFKQKFKKHLYSLPNLIQAYILNLFPIIQWIHRYNFSWLLQDMIAGVTVGMLIVPQGIAYAKIANLDPQYGLYTSFVGVTLYCFFGTSKDISIGPITVVSLLVGQAITQVKETNPEITGPEVAVCLSLFTGLVLVLIGLVRLGILVDFISEPAIAGYMTGSAITISMGQWPKIFGLENVDTHDSPYLITYNFFKHIREIRLDAAFGLTALAILYIIKFGSSKLANCVPCLKKPLFFLGIMRSGLVVILGTAISFVINHHQPIVDIIQEVPAGFDAMAIPSINLTILKQASDVLPSIILILILEHVSVAKSFGRMSNYAINPNQEILAIGMSNIIGSFFGAYPSTGAFSRTAVMSRSGAKTPMAGVFSGAVVVLALYALTPAFYYIPEAVLGAVVIHAVIDLISGPEFLKSLWKAGFFELLVFIIAVTVTCVLDVETAIYISIVLSLLLLLLRLARPHVFSLGRVKISSLTSNSSRSSQKSVVHDVYGVDMNSRYIFVNDTDPHFYSLLDPLPPGVVVVQLSQSILYPNANYVIERITDIIKSKTRSGCYKEDKTTDMKLERPWNEPIPSSKEEMLQRNVKPYLDCIILDFSAVNLLDATALHTLHSLKNSLLIYAGGKQIEWHFCHVDSKVRQLLIDAGFNNEVKTKPKNDSHIVDTVTILDSYLVEINEIRHEKDQNVMMELLPKDKYTNFHWDLESAVYSICIRRQNEQQQNNPSSITVTVY